MLASLARPDGVHLVGTLARVGRTFPHALYYSLRTAYLEFRTPAQPGPGSSAPSSSATPTARPAVSRAPSMSELPGLSRTASMTTLDSGPPPMVRSESIAAMETDERRRGLEEATTPAAKRVKIEDDETEHSDGLVLAICSHYLNLSHQIG